MAVIDGCATKIVLKTSNHFFKQQFFIGAVRARNLVDWGDKNIAHSQKSLKFYLKQVV